MEVSISGLGQFGSWSILLLAYNSVILSKHNSILSSPKPKLSLSISSQYNSGAGLKHPQPNSSLSATCPVLAPEQTPQLSKKAPCNKS